MTATIDAVGLDADRPVLDWLRAVGERRDLTLAAPSHAHAPALAALLAALSRECADGEELARAAHEAARTIADGVAALRRGSGDEASRAGALTAVVAEARAVLERHAEMAAELRRFVDSFGASIAETRESVSRTAGDLQGGLDVLTASAGPLGEMRGSIAALDEFIAILARLSRHSQLLGVNASIEAAHLGDMGSRFAIVAAELRDLSAA
jgi:methyl-accepting chemotaxis protein